MEGALFDAYRHTTFHANTPHGRLILRVGQRCVELDDLLHRHGVITWGYVTAFNPGSVLLSVDVNVARQSELERAIATLGLVSYPGEGVGEEGCWPPEPSFLVLGISRGDALKLGQKFGQLAVVCGELGREAELVVCGPIADAPEQHQRRRL